MANYYVLARHPLASHWKEEPSRRLAPPPLYLVPTPMSSRTFGSNDGYISVDELTAILSRKAGGSELARENAEYLIKIYDTSNNNKLSIDEVSDIRQATAFCMRPADIFSLFSRAPSPALPKHLSTFLFSRAFERSSHTHYAKYACCL